MKTVTRYYVGPSASGLVATGTRHIPFTRGRPTQFTPAEAAELSDNWTTRRPRKPQADPAASTENKEAADDGQ